MVGTGVKPRRRGSFLRNKRVRRWILLIFAILILAWLLSLAILDPDGFAAFFSAGSRPADPGGTVLERERTDSSPQRTEESAETQARPLDIARTALRELRRDPTDRDRYLRFERLFETLDEESKEALAPDRENVLEEMARRFEPQVRDELNRLAVRVWQAREKGRFHQVDHALTTLNELYPKFTAEAQERFESLRQTLEEALVPWIAERRASIEKALAADDPSAASVAMRRLLEAGDAAALRAGAELLPRWRSSLGAEATDGLDREGMARAAAAVVDLAFEKPAEWDEFAMLDGLLALLVRAADGEALWLLGRIHRDLELVAFAATQRHSVLREEGLAIEPVEGLTTSPGTLSIQDSRLRLEVGGEPLTLGAADLDEESARSLSSALFENYGLGPDLERFCLALLLAHLGDPRAERLMTPNDRDEEPAALVGDRRTFLEALAQVSR